MSDTVLDLRVAATAALEATLNRLLSLDPAAANNIAKLQDKVLHVHILTPELNLYFIPQGDQLGLQSFYEGEVETLVEGSPSDFIELMLAKDPASALINGNITIKGSTTPLLDLQHTLKNTQLDWEYELSKLVGDIAAHEIGKFIKNSTQWLKNQKPVIDEHIKDTIYNQARLLANREDIKQFCDDVDDLSARFERFEAKLKQQ